MNNKNNNRSKIRFLTATGMFCALAYVCTVLIHPPIQFLTLDVKDSIIVLCSLLLGPVSGVAVGIIVPLLEFVTISDTGVYGLIMNVLSSVVFALVTGLIYRYKKSMVGAIAGLVSGVCLVTLVMLGANLLITPYYMHVPRETVVSLIPTLLLPFNLVKAILNAAIVLLLYKPISTALKKIGFIRMEKSVEPSVGVNKRRSLIVTLIAAAVIVISLLVVFCVLR